MITDTIRSLLAANSGVSSIVGKRVFQAAASAGQTMPHVVLSLSSNDRMNANGGPTGLAVAMIELASVAKTAKAAGELGQAVRLAMITMADETISQIEQDGEYDAPNLDDSQAIFVRVQTFLVCHYE